MINGITVPNPDGGLPTVPVKHYRIWDMGVTWKHINTSAGVYDWTKLDAIVDQLIGAGATNLTYVIGATPQWCAKDPHLANYASWLGEGSNSQPVDNTHWMMFCDKVARRYLGKISSYEIWNEPQLKDFWGYDSWTALAKMTWIANDTIHKVSSTLKTLSGAVLPRPSSGGMTRGGKYLSALKAEGWPCDIWNAHMYPEIGYTPGRVRTFCQDWQAKLSELSAPTKPKWITEINYNLGGGILNNATQDDYIRRTQTVCNDMGVFKAYWYCWNHSDPNLFGLRFASGTQATATLGAFV